MQDQLWQAVLGEIELSVSRGNYVTWFKNSRLLQKKDDQIVVGVHNVFAKKQFEERFNDLIKDTLEKNGVSPKHIKYKIAPSLSPKSSEEDIEPLVLQSSANAPASSKSKTVLTHTYRKGVNERYTFENFIVGSGNELAYAACQAVATSPGSRYNPLFIYGGVGIGKTHLLHAVGNSIRSVNPNAHVVYVSSEQFIQEFLDAIRYKKNTDFAGFYRGADVLIVDDIQFIAGKEKTQEEFFHTFNALHQANKQIIISSDRPPNEIPTLESRLSSRLKGGMSIDMQTPDFETRCAIVQIKSEAHSVSLPAEVVEFLANYVQTNIRELEGALNQLLAYCDMSAQKPSLDLATTIFNASKTKLRRLKPQQIIEKTAKYFGVGLDEIVGPKRDKEIVVPRQVAMYLLRSELHLSFPKIARELGRKDHTTALHSVEKITNAINKDSDLKSAVFEIKEKLHA